jgi:hypothetical protein
VLLCESDGVADTGSAVYGKISLALSELSLSDMEVLANILVFRRHVRGEREGD